MHGGGAGDSGRGDKEACRAVFVIATQNPVETIGCFPLPEAQLDRFIMKIPMGLLSAPEERRMLDRFINAEPLAELDAVCSAEEIQRLQAACREVYVHEELREYP